MRVRTRSPLLLLTILLVGCRQPPSHFEHSQRTAKSMEVYLSSSAVAAEVAILDLEKYTRECEEAGSPGINFDAAYAAIYSRLYLIDLRLGRREPAEAYYEKAASRWEREYRRRGLSLPTPEAMRQQITAVDGGIGEPQWRTQD
jgi:hypothetical protein